MPRLRCRSWMALALTSLTSFAWTGPLEDDLDRLRDAALASPYAFEQLAHLADSVGPRLSGSPGAAAAVRFVAKEMRAQGFEVRLQEVAVPRWVRGEEEAALTDWPGKDGDYRLDLSLTTLGGSVATPDQGLEAEVVVVGSFEQLAALTDDQVRGKVVLFDVPFDVAMARQGRAADAYRAAVQYRARGAVEAAKRGAVASLIRSVGSLDFQAPHTGVMWYQDDVPRIPHAALTAEDAGRVARLAARGPVRLHLRLTPRTDEDATSHNVIADLVGRERPDEVVLVTGHLDSWDLGTGAVDDGSGVALAMATLKLVKDLGLRPRRTLRMVAWMNEENGMRGVKEYLRQAGPTLIHHQAAFEADFGIGHPLGVVLNAHPALRAALAPAATCLATQGAGIADARPSPVGSDIAHLGRAGVPTLAPLSDTRDYFDLHHTPADTLDKVDPRHLAENVAVAAVYAYTLAQGDLPRRDTAAVVAETLDAWHQAASRADLDAYLGAFAPEGVFLGTDDGERWDVEQFRAFVEPYFSKGQGWTYEPASRHVQLSPDGELAWVDEKLDNEHYGRVRGTAVLRWHQGAWKIVHYSLSFPVPNDKAKAVVGLIRGDTQVEAEGP